MFVRTVGWCFANQRRNKLGTCLGSNGRGTTNTAAYNIQSVAYNELFIHLERIEKIMEFAFENEDKNLFNECSSTLSAISKNIGIIREKFKPKSPATISLE